jgi:hypothetical protein
MQALSEKTFQPSALHYLLLDVFTMEIINDYNNTPMQQFIIPVKATTVPDTHHMVDNYHDPEEFENRAEDYEHEALIIDQQAELQLLEFENN